MLPGRPDSPVAPFVLTERLTELQKDLEMKNMLVNYVSDDAS